MVTAQATHLKQQRRPPLYAQIADQLARDIRGRGLHAGDRLPSERVLCEDLGVSRVTLRAALRQLLDQGVVSAEAARGWFVADPPPVPVLPEVPRGAVRGFTDEAARRGQPTSARVLQSWLRPADLDEADAFGIVAGSVLFELRRVRFIDGLVIAVDHSRIPAAVHPGIESADFRSTSLYRLLRSGPDPVIPSTAEYAVEALPATPEEARFLDLDAGVALLVATQRTRDQRGRVFELGRTAYRGDRFRFRAWIGAAPEPEAAASAEVSYSHPNWPPPQP